MTASSGLNLQDFSAIRGDTFALVGAAEAAPRLRLAEVSSLGFNVPAARGGRESFSLIFHAPAGFRWTQGNYRLQHPTLGEHVIFLVPLGPEGDMMRLEAIFNLL